MSRRVLFQSYDLSWSEWVWFLKMYRILRIAIYANQAYTGPEQDCYQGCYGMSRAEARDYLEPIIATVSWAAYLGSK